MRNILLIGSAATALMFSVAGAYAIPPNSPYAIMQPQAVDGQMGAQANEAGAFSLLNPFGMIEGRSAYVERDNSEMTPWQATTPENSTYFSRGR